MKFELVTKNYTYQLYDSIEKKKKNSGTFFNMEKQKIFRKLFLRESFHFANKKKNQKNYLTHYKFQSILDHLTRLAKKRKEKNLKKTTSFTVSFKNTSKVSSRIAKVFSYRDPNERFNHGVWPDANGIYSKSSIYFFPTETSSLLFFFFFFPFLALRF